MKFNWMACAVPFFSILHRTGMPHGPATTAKLCPVQRISGTGYPMLIVLAYMGSLPLWAYFALVRKRYVQLVYGTI